MARLDEKSKYGTSLAIVLLLRRDGYHDPVVCCQKSIEYGE